MYKGLRYSCTVLLVLAAATIVCSAAVKKPAPKPVAKKPVIAAAPKLLSAVVAGQPFEPVAASGSSAISITLCPEENAAATFTARCSKAVTGVSVASSDIVGKTTISKTSVTVRLVSGDNLLGCTNVQLGPTPAQFWINVSAPRTAKPGSYAGSIVFFVAGKVVDRVPYQVTVLPLRLIGSSKQYALYTTLGPGSGACDLSGPAYGKFLSRAAFLGFRAVSVNCSPDRLGEALSACCSAGLLGCAPVLTYAWGESVPSTQQMQTMEDARRTTTLGSIYSFCCNNPATEAELTAAISRAEHMRWAKLQVGATVSDDATLQKLMPYLHGVNYRIDMPYVQALINGGSSRTNKWEWYWWDARQSVRDNRIFSGIALWKSGLYGCMPSWIPKDPADKADNLDTLQAEALREGIIDTRYITTYMKALRELKDKKREPDKEYIASTEAYLSAFLARPFGKITPADYRAFRAKMTEFSLKLAAML